MMIKLTKEQERELIKVLLLNYREVLCDFIQCVLSELQIDDEFTVHRLAIELNKIYNKIWRAIGIQSKAKFRIIKERNIKDTSAANDNC